MRPPEIKDDPMYQLLREEKIEEFNQRRAGGEACDLQHADLRGLDLRGLEAKSLNMMGCYFRQADIRGINFSSTNLEQASICCAKISGAYFPLALTADEIALSQQHGTCMRYKK
ncbi:MAG: pentapeptide repeat-containing protein [Candidatus Polarisedimenticolaceae bacterium]|nr:pentapeptide repeat-containing protein [Candidatus Polarisedimenticolaceae bacterium]